MPVAVKHARTQRSGFNMLHDLPEIAYNVMVEQYMTNLEVKTLRLVSKGLKFWIDTNLTALNPRAFSRSQVILSESLMT